MPASGNYSATEHMRDGREIEIRALRPDDKDDMLDPCSALFSGTE